MKYEVCVDLRISTTIEIDADSHEEAIELAERQVDDDWMYYANWGDYVGTSVYSCEEK